MYTHKNNDNPRYSPSYCNTYCMLLFSLSILCCLSHRTSNAATTPATVKIPVTVSTTPNTTKRSTKNSTLSISSRTKISSAASGGVSMRTSFTGTEYKANATSLVITLRIDGVTGQQEQCKCIATFLCEATDQILVYNSRPVTCTERNQACCARVNGVPVSSIPVAVTSATPPIEQTTGDYLINDCVFPHQCGMNETDVVLYGAGNLSPRAPPCPVGKIRCIIALNSTVRPPPVTSVTGNNVNCTCLEPLQCGNNETDSLYYGQGVIDRRTSQCSAGLVCCIVEGLSPTVPPIETTTDTTTSETPGTVTQPTLNLTTSGACGYRQALTDTSKRIVNPDQDSTSFGELPWTTLLLRHGLNDNGTMSENIFAGGGSLVAPSIILTAAHTVWDLTSDALKVRAGEYNAMTGSSDEPLPHQDRKVKRIFIHPNFNNATLHNDVALLRLVSPFDITPNVNTICLPTAEDVSNSASSTSSQGYYQRDACLVSGWGKNAFDPSGKFQTTLRKVDLPIVDSASCVESLKKTRLGSYFRLHESFICAGGVEGKDACIGDGGGPLVCLQANSANRYVQLGIVSWGIGCGENGVPGVYASIGHNLQWISDSINTLEMQ